LGECRTGRGQSALIGGKGEYLLLFMNLADPSKQLWLRVKRTRLGAVAHGGAGLLVGYMSGVRDAKVVKGLKSSGVDFELDVGARLGAVAKSARLKKVREALLKASESRKLARGNIHNAAERRAKAELGKQYANLVNGDLSADMSGRKFLVLSTPAGAGFGAGVFYEWQSVYTLGGSAWAYAKPKWRLLGNGPKSNLLQIKRATEEVDTLVHVSLFVKRFPKDERLYFRGGSTGREGGSTSTGPMTFFGVVGAFTTFTLVGDGSSGLQTGEGHQLIPPAIIGDARAHR
jgi:hypothetical protein